MGRLRSFLRMLRLSRLAMIGAALTTSAIVAYFALAFGEVFVFRGNPYWGLVLNMVFPGIALAGLILIAGGLFLKARAAGTRFSFSALARLAESRRIEGAYVWQVVATLSLVNVALFALFSYRGYHFTESREFCGELCHTVMEPEYTVYRLSPHSEISCAECHIGSGATWYVKSKLSGMRQVYAVLTGDYSRPIETPVHNLRPAREVCEVCHRPEMFLGDRIRVFEHYAADRENSRSYNVLNMRVGGGGERAPAHGIHWHVSRDEVVRYHAADERREQIDWIDLRGPNGDHRVWTRPGRPLVEADLAPGGIRTMDCIDCHNRPTHIFASPQGALDDLLSLKKIDPAIPWIRKYGEEILRASYATTDEARAAIAGLTELYREREPEAWSERREAIEAAVAPLQEVHRAYIYPRMNVGWNTYPSLIGHPAASTMACFRCHDGLMRDGAGEAITVDCNSCHAVLAREEESPPILDVLSGR